MKAQPWSVKVPSAALQKTQRAETGLVKGELVS